MVKNGTATPQINRFGTDAERGQLSEWEAIIVEKLRMCRKRSTVDSSGTGISPRSMPANRRIEDESYNASSAPGPRD